MNETKSESEATARSERPRGHRGDDTPRGHPGRRKRRFFREAFRTTRRILADFVKSRRRGNGLLRQPARMRLPFLVVVTRARGALAR